MKIREDERIFRVFLGSGVVSRFERVPVNRYYDKWIIEISADVHVGYPKLTLAEAKEAKSFLASHAEIRTVIDDTDIVIGPW